MLKDPREPLRKKVMEVFVGFTGELKYLKVHAQLQSHKSVLRQLETKDEQVFKNVTTSLINLSSHADCRTEMIKSGAIITLIEKLLSPKCLDKAALINILSNLTLGTDGQRSICQFDKEVLKGYQLSRLLEALVRPIKKDEDDPLKKLLNVFINVSQTKEARELLLMDSGIMIYLVPQIRLNPELHRDRVVGALNVLRNLCFDTQNFKEILKEQHKLQPALFKFIIFSKSELDDESELQKLPPYIQKLAEGDTPRTEDTTIRKLVIEILGSLALDADARKVLRSGGIQLMLKYLLLWEPDIGLERLEEALQKEMNEEELEKKGGESGSATKEPKMIPVPFEQRYYKGTKNTKSFTAEEGNAVFDIFNRE